LRFQGLATRLVDAPRGVVIALVAVTALISPGFVRVSGEAHAPLAGPDTRGAIATERRTAIFALGCSDGVFTPGCLRFVTRLSQALELEAAVAGNVRSLLNARVVVRSGDDELRLEPLSPRVPATESGLRALRERALADPAQAKRFLAADGRTTFVYAELSPRLQSEGARALATSLRLRFERAPGLTLSVTSLAEPESRTAASLFAVLALSIATLGLAIAPGSWRASVLAGLAAGTFAVFAHALVGFLDASGRLRASFAPEILAAVALATSFALIQRTRAERRREPDDRAALAAALAEIGPPLAVVAAMAVVGFAAQLALAPELPLARGLAAAGGLATALIVYPLGVTLAGIRLWPGVLTETAGELGSALGRRVEPVLVRPRFLVCLALLAAAVAVGALPALSPGPDAAHLRRVILDSGRIGGALEPAFLEQVQAFQRATERQPGVSWSSSLVETVVAPAYRSLHDGEPAFSTVPPTRTEITRALRPWQRDERQALARLVDDERRRVAVEVFELPARAVVLPFSAPALASISLSLLGVGALSARMLRSVNGGMICALPGAFTALVIFGLAGLSNSKFESSAGALAPLSVGISGAFALQLLTRVRALIGAQAELEVALSLSLRDTGPVIASAAAGGAAAVALAAAASNAPAWLVGLACLVPGLSAVAVLTTVPGMARSVRGRFFAEPRGSHRGLQTPQE
jgi:hypothetical protein